MPFHPIWLAVILVVVLIIFGPGRLPELGGAVGKAMREFRKATSELTSEVTSAVRSNPHSQRPGQGPGVHLLVRQLRLVPWPF
ncbi:MAG: twin-arginine translocase TatA/TatE family subunit [Chloroflexi bacterium]|nr:MAG: twin-arginine translocase TatA/TatE family subunit [Chloroflexota bacterium]